MISMVTAFLRSLSPASLISLVLARPGLSFSRYFSNASLLAISLFPCFSWTTMRPRLPCAGHRDEYKAAPLPRQAAPRPRWPTNLV